MSRRPRKTNLDLVALRLERLRRTYVWGQRVSIDVRPGVVAFLQPLKASAIPGVLYPKWRSDRLKFARLSFGGRDYKIVQYCGGKWEIYRIEDDHFTETFLGYDTDILPSLLRGAHCLLEGPS